jgi:hypothetical protein
VCLYTQHNFEINLFERSLSVDGQRPSSGELNVNLAGQLSFVPSVSLSLPASHLHPGGLADTEERVWGEGVGALINW